MNSRAPMKLILTSLNQQQFTSMYLKRELSVFGQHWNSKEVLIFNFVSCLFN